VEEAPDGRLWVTVRERDGRMPKWGSAGRIPLPEMARPTIVALAAWRSSENPTERVVPGVKGGALCPRMLSRRFKHYARKAKLPEEIKLHTLRHTYASWLAMAGEDQFRIQQLMRHKDGATTARYMHLSPDHLAASV